MATEAARESREKWDASASSWIRHVRRLDVNREFLLDAPMLREAGEVRDKNVLDLGCGEGRFCRMLAARGAKTTGIDPTQAFLEHASLAHPEGRYVQAVGETLPFSGESFDLVVTYLTLIDIPDFRGAIREVARVLRPGGSAVVANLNSFATTRPTAWYRDKEGNKLHLAVEDYFEERALVLEWSGISIINWHRPMQEYMAAFLSSGFVLRHFEEPRPTLEAVEVHPSMIDEYRVPLFHVMRWERI